MTREQMIAWLTLEGVYVQDYNDNGNLWEAYVPPGGTTTRFYDSRGDCWARVCASNFDGGPDVPWASIPTNAIAELCERVLEYKGETK